MFKYVLKRIGYALVILLGVSLIIYALVRMMPVSYIEMKIAQMNQATVDQSLIQKMKEMYGLEDDSFMGVIKGYFSWLTSMLQGDLGTSFMYGDSVVSIIADNMGVSFIIAFISMVFQFMISIPLGITAATHQYSIRDYVITVFVMIGISLPSFFFAQYLKSILSLDLGWLPPSGLIDASVDNYGWALIVDYLKHLALPLITITVISIGGTMRYTRTNMLEVLNSDYIRTARAKGLSEGKVIYKHAFRNTMIPLVTMMAGILPGLFSGSMITEQVFDLPGIGNVAYKAMAMADIPFIMGYNMFISVLAVFGTLLADLMYGVVDPRVKLA